MNEAEKGTHPNAAYPGNSQHSEALQYERVHYTVVLCTEPRHSAAILYVLHALLGLSVNIVVVQDLGVHHNFPSIYR